MYLSIVVSASDRNQNSGFGRTLDASIEGKTFYILNDVKKLFAVYLQFMLNLTHPFHLISLQPRFHYSSNNVLWKNEQHRICINL